MRGRRIGGHMLQSTMLYTRIFGRKVRILFSPNTGTAVFSGVYKVARMENGTLEYGNEGYRFR